MESGTWKFNFLHYNIILLRRIIKRRIIIYNLVGFLCWVLSLNAFGPTLHNTAIWFLHPPQRQPEATACSVRRSLNASRGKVAHDKNWQNAERDCQRYFTKLGLSLPIEIQKIDHELTVPETQQVTTYHIKPQDWLKHWMNNNPELMGGWNGNPAQNFESFWKLYKSQHPSHEVFRSHSDHLESVCPLLIHGDEGRGLKKTGYLVVAVETPFGSQQDDRISKGCSCESFLASRPDLPSLGVSSANHSDDNSISIADKQLTNFKGHSYLSHWMIFGLGGWIYKKHPQVATKLLEELSLNMSELFEQGVVLQNGKTVFAALVGIKGDLDFHEKYMKLERSYSHLGSRNKIEICHLCKAGSARYPFEDFAEEPEWALPASMLASRPWGADAEPVLSRIPFDNGSPEVAIRHDPFHVVKVGVARDVIGGTLIYLLRKGFFDAPGDSKNIRERFCRAHSVFSLWAKAEKKTPQLRSFTKAYFNMVNLMSAPWASSKASDSTLLLQWLIWYIQLNLIYPSVCGHERILRYMLEVCQSTLDINVLHHHGLWLRPACAKRVYVAMVTSLRGYAFLGRQSLQYGIRSFILKPKHHALHHIAHAMRMQLLSGSRRILSPQCFSCDTNEDFVGRVSRLSRRVNIRVCDLRVYQRYFLKIQGLLRRRKSGLGVQEKCAPKTRTVLRPKVKRISTIARTRS